jgi:hypothetical protein
MIRMPGLVTWFNNTYQPGDAVLLEDGDQEPRAGVLIGTAWLDAGEAVFLLEGSPVRWPVEAVVDYWRPFWFRKWGSPKTPPKLPPQVHGFVCTKGRCQPWPINK